MKKNLLHLLAATLSFLFFIGGFALILFSSNLFHAWWKSRDLTEGSEVWSATFLYHHEAWTTSPPLWLLFFSALFVGFLSFRLYRLVSNF